MKTYLADIIPKIQRFSQKLDDITKLTNQPWVVINDIDSTKVVYIFRQNGELLISQDGRVEKAKWEYLGFNSLLIDLKDESFLFKHGFFDDSILALKIDNKDEYALLVNETKFEKELNSSSRVLEFLREKYIDESAKFDSLPSYIALEIVSQTQTTESSFLEGEWETINFEFADGVKGSISFKPSNDEFYFKDKKGFFRYYDTLDNCINALHYFQTTGNRLEVGYKGTYV